MTYHKAFNKCKKTQNITGFYRVSINKSSDLKKGFRFQYSINNEVIKVNITSTNLLKLKEKVIKNGLHWLIIDKEKALKTCIRENINPLELNPNINYHYINYVFDSEDLKKYEKLKKYWEVLKTIYE